MAALKPGKGEDRPQGDADPGEGKKRVKAKTTTVKDTRSLKVLEVIKNIGKQRGSKGTSKEDEERAAEQLEAEHRQQEEEERRWREEAAREQQRPKDYSPEERELAERLADEMEQFFGGLTVRQLEDPEQVA
jgi:hypothetical protein